MCLLACSRLSDSGKAREYGEDPKVKDANRPSSPQFPSCFSCLRFLNSAGPTMSEPGTGLSLQLTPTAFVVIGSLFLNIRLHSILNNRKKEVREEDQRGRDRR